MLRRLYLAARSKCSRAIRLRLAIKSRGPIHVGRSTFISHQALLFGDGDHLTIGENCHIHPFAYIRPYGGFISIGDRSSVNPFTVIYGHGGLTIGNDVRIAAHCTIIPSNHNFSDIETPIALQGENSKGIVIENDVWIGTGVRILDGVVIGQGSVIGAGSVVTRSIPPYSVALGVPAKVVRKRDA